MNEATIDDLPPALRLALAYAPRPARDTFSTLFALDWRLARLVAAPGEPLPKQLKLAWWRDRFAEPVADWPLAALPQLSGWSDDLGRLVARRRVEALLAEDRLSAGLEEFCRAAPRPGISHPPRRLWDRRCGEGCEAVGACRPERPCLRSEDASGSNAARGVSMARPTSARTATDGGPFGAGSTRLRKDRPMLDAPAPPRSQCGLESSGARLG